MDEQPREEGTRTQLQQAGPPYPAASIEAVAIGGSLNEVRPVICHGKLVTATGASLTTWEEQQSAAGVSTWKSAHVSIAKESSSRAIRNRGMGDGEVGSIENDLDRGGSIKNENVKLPITCIFSDTGYRTRFWSGGMDGYLRQWDILDGSLLRELNVGVPIIHATILNGVVWIIAPTNSSKDQSLYASKDEQSDIKMKVNKGRKASERASALTFRIWMSTMERLREKSFADPNRMKLMLKPSTQASISSSNDQRTIASFDKNSIFIWKADGSLRQTDKKSSKSNTSWLSLHQTKRVQCTAIHPYCSMLASGDCTGRICVWHGIATAIFESTPQDRRKNEIVRESGTDSGRGHASSLYSTTYHWHAQGVLSLQFSSDGKLLYSGSHESVLVIWDIENGGTKSFLPRIGGKISYITCDEQDEAVIWLSCSDNCIRRANLADKSVQIGARGIGPPPRGAIDATMRLLSADVNLPSSEKKSNRILVSVPNASLQVFDISGHGQHVGNVQIAPRNSVMTSQELRRLERGAASEMECQVMFVAIGNKGFSMCTVDVRPDGDVEGSTQCCLRFWEIDRLRDGGLQELNGDITYSEFSSMCLNSVTDSPHDEGIVTAVEMHPDEGLCGTASNDGSFRIWERRAIQESVYYDPPSGTPSVLWHCTSVGSYMKRPFTSLTFSSDGSLLVVGSSATDDSPPVVTLWEVGKNVLLVKVFCCTYDKPIENKTIAADNKRKNKSPRSVSWLSLLDKTACPIIAVQIDNGDGSKSFGMHSILDPDIPRWTGRFANCKAVASSSSKSKLVIACSKDVPSFGNDEQQPDQNIIVIDALASTALSSIMDIRNIHLGLTIRNDAVIAITIIDVPEEDSIVVILTKDRSILKLRLDGKGRLSSNSNSWESIKFSETNAVDFDKNSERSAFSKIYGETIAEQQMAGLGVAKRNFSKSNLSFPHLPAGTQPWSPLLDAPAHVLPPLMDLCSPFMDKLIGL